MSEQIHEQVSAFLDGELPASETELLLKRLGRDADLRERFGRYALIGEAVRGASHAHFARAFPTRVNAAIDGGPSLAAPVTDRRAASPRWLGPLAGAAVAAGVAVVAVLALQQRAVTPNLTAAANLANRTAASAVAASGAAPVVPVVARQLAKSNEALSYTVPTTLSEAPAALPEARLTNYVFAHSKYSSLLGQRDVLSGLIAGGEAADGEPPAAGPMPAVNDAVLPGTTPTAEIRIAP